MTEHTNNIPHIPFFEEYIKKAEVKLTQKQISLFELLKSELIEWNKNINLTGITDDRGIELKHFADSLTLLQVSQIKKAAQIIDIGTGAGFPGIPLAIALPDTQIILVESIKKKVTFLEHVKEKLELKNVTIYNARIEDLDPNRVIDENLIQKTLLTARAVSALSDLSTWSEKFLHLGITACFQKSKRAVEVELADILKKHSGIHAYHLTYSEIPVESHGFPELDERVFVLCHNDAIVR